MRIGVACLAMAVALFAAAGAGANDSAQITFMFEKGAFCQTSGGSAQIVFADTGADTNDQNGSLGLECTTGTVPIVTVSGDGASPGSYDFSGKMYSGGNWIAFRGSWTAQPVGAGMGTPISWTFTARAMGLSTAPAGSYSTALIFTINP